VLGNFKKAIILITFI